VRGFQPPRTRSHFHLPRDRQSDPLLDSINRICGKTFDFGQFLQMSEEAMTLPVTHNTVCQVLGNPW